ncbi:hypothetical protein CK228_28540 [Mesorhizobium sp. WSM4312]|nr:MULTISPECIES: hypothetical protein [unclassified Mesorhizobium]PBB65224.1 hypothetical protein CK228_28540 [Mesorhizobium sp. WSM4312]PBC18656.1 hypothetical protein CK226_33605 [Mesorhizobium sp. WSM4311]TRC78181.1 hypothetical protein FJV81_10660 [Mesorhizobium sp. WSM4315]TRC79350.1 hypothetical protein FJV83_28415 [Mesorhizobium sp. WSM4307]TRC80268.1 hypothetical protein FJV80_22760 [Mesorhizobium sp. WSM4310]
MWQPIVTAPFSRILELAVLDEEGAHSLVFPCERTEMGWRNAIIGVPVDIHPTHWRDWIEQKRPANDSPAGADDGRASN